MGRLKEDPPPGTPSLGCPTPPTPPCLPQAAGSQGQQEDLEGWGLLLQAHVAQALALGREIWAPSSAPSHPGLEEGRARFCHPIPWS